MTLADLVASGRATCSVEEAGAILGVGRCTAFEQAAAGTLPTIRVGRRLLVPVPRLLTMLGIPLPDEWQPSAALAPRCQSAETGSNPSDLGSSHPKLVGIGSAQRATNRSEKPTENDLAAGVRPLRG